MPEGHTIHRVARKFTESFLNQPLQVSSPQGRFAQGAALLDGHRAVRAFAHGKHFFLEFEHRMTMNVHLGLYGAWSFGGDARFTARSSLGAPRKMGEQEVHDDAADSPSRPYAGPPAARATVRVRLESEHGYADLVGASICRVLEPTGVVELRRRLGPDPLDPTADPEAFYRACAGTSRSIAAVLMDQGVIAGIGNIYRAEVLFRVGLNPHIPAHRVPREQLEALWRDAAALMGEGVKLGRIITTAPEHRGARSPEALGKEHAHYVYLRHGKVCRVCGQEAITVEDLGGRRLYWCTICQG